MSIRKSILLAVSLIILIITIPGTANARSVYVIADTIDSNLAAYKVQDANLVWQTNYICKTEPPGGTGAVGLAIDESDYGDFLLITFEGLDVIELVNAKTMEYVDSLTATGASNLAGIVVDPGKQKVYVVDRGTKYLYVYNWYPNIPELVQDGNRIELEGLVNELVGGAWGLALDEQNHHLYITSNQTKVRFYDTNDWSHDPNTDYITVSHDAVGVAVDVNAYVYTGSGFYGTLLSRYDLSADPNTAETTVDVGAPVLGIAVDQQTGLVYLTTYGVGGDYYYQDPPWDRLFVYDSNFNPLPLWVSNDIGSPAGVAVGSASAYKPPAFYLEKVDVNEPNCVLPGDYITYKITYGPNGLDHNNVEIIDYLPCQVEYINPYDPNYDSNSHTYKWQIGSLSASAPNDFVMLTVYVNLGVEPNGIITNYCEIESDHYRSFVSADTNVCFWSPDIIYVDVNAVGCNSGLSWYHADPNLQRALWKAQAWDVNQIWVAEGTYKPTIGSDRSISFELLDGVAIYGGFAGTESHPNQRNLTDPNNETILCGDIGTPVDQNDNSYHVVKCENVDNAILDGFTITAGNANAYYTDEPNRCGGGIYCKNSNVIKVANCTIIQNEGLYGGGIYNYNCSSLMITNCTIIQNEGLYDGGIYNYNCSSLMITNCSFSDNSSLNGGALYNSYSSSDVNITNCVFTGNTAKHYGGGIYNYCSSPAVTNCTFSENYAVGYIDGIYTYFGFGGGIANNYLSSPMITNCTFSGNSAKTLISEQKTWVNFAKT